MSTFKIAYAASASVAGLTLASLATSSTRTAGAESDAIDNGTNLYDDILIGGKITPGTSPTANKQIDVWIVAQIEDGGLWPDVMDGTGSAETWTSENVRNAGGKLLKSIVVDATSDRTYYFSNESVAGLFGGVLPKKFVVFVAHDTGVNLNATGSNHALYQTGVTYTAA
jgi:hypothetical protein